MESGWSASSHVMTFCSSSRFTPSSRAERRPLLLPHKTSGQSARGSSTTALPTKRSVFLMPTQKTLRVGMIGYNFMGKAHSNAWRQAGKFFDLPAKVELKTICGRSGASVERAKEQLGWSQTSTDWREVVNDPGIDIIDICTPNDTHAEIAIAAAAQGKAILCEKPLGMDVEQCEQMV